MSAEDAIVRIAESIAEAGPKALDAVNRLFPGVAERSKANAASHEVRAVMGDMGALMRMAEQVEMSPEMQVSFANMVFERHGSDQRVAAAAVHALPLIEEDGDPYGVDDEWLDYWRVHAGMARAEDMQALWGAVLAGEVNKPGAVSKRAMSALSELSRDEAEALKAYCSKCVGLSVDGDEPFMVWPCLSAASPDLEVLPGPFALSSGELSALLSAGLIDGWPTRLQLDQCESVVFIFGGVGCKIAGKGGSGEIPEGTALYFQLSNAGRELSAFANMACSGFTAEDLRALLAAAGLDVEQVEIPEGERR